VVKELAVLIHSTRVLRHTDRHTSR